MGAVVPLGPHEAVASRLVLVVLPVPAVAPLVDPRLSRATSSAHAPSQPPETPPLVRLLPPPATPPAVVNTSPRYDSEPLRQATCSSGGPFNSDDDSEDDVDDCRDAITVDSSVRDPSGGPKVTHTCQPTAYF